MDSQGMVMLKTDQGKITEISVADPSRKLNKLMLTVSGMYEVDGDGYHSYPNPKVNETLFIIDLPQDVYHGKSVTFKL